MCIAVDKSCANNKSQVQELFLDEKRKGTRINEMYLEKSRFLFLKVVSK
jgi:hypothetical protein